MLVRRKIEILGLVQGVGFRPYVARMAKGRLTGSVLNGAGGVEIEVQGSEAEVSAFVSELKQRAPPSARIFHLSDERIAPRPMERTFTIGPSRLEGRRRALIPPDVPTCAACVRELFDPKDRRYRYPFINCAQCGPRYTIITEVPYDRPRTSMAGFVMCEACRREFEDPHNRRFHAQPIACPRCGPRLSMEGAENPLRETKRLLAEGRIVAIKSLGGFHLACDATNEEAVAMLRNRKHRPGKPFALMVRNIDSAMRRARIEDQRALCGEHPIVLLPKLLSELVPERDALAPSVAPKVSRIGLFLPYTPLHHLLFEGAAYDALVMTSGNISEEPIAIDDEEAKTRLHGVADALLTHDRPIVSRCDDSVVDAVGGRIRSVRRSRGFAPVPIWLRDAPPPILAVGAHLKSTICVTRDRFAFLSPHIGDLESYETYRFFEATVDQMRRFVGEPPQVIAHDLHPRYRSTAWAEGNAGSARLVGVQHHHAHVAACMAEHDIDGSVIGVALDGAGYGLDGKIWGGEILIATRADFSRFAHLPYVSMPGGTAAVKEPWRMAVSWLHHFYGARVLELDLELLHRVGPSRLAQLVTMIERGVNSPSTSSCGRLFDAVAALVTDCNEVSYEGQAAVELEALVDDDAPGSYAMSFSNVAPLFDALRADLDGGAPRSVMATRFHRGLLFALRDVVIRARDKCSIDRVCLSGGCLQNAWLAAHLEATLTKAGFTVFVPQKIPTNDGGISLGQVTVAAARILRETAAGL